MRRSILASILVLVAFAVPVRANQPCGGSHPACPPPPPVAMGRLFTTGFEAKDGGALGGNAGVDGLIGTKATFDTTIVRTGAVSLKLTQEAGGGIAGFAFAYTSPALGADVFARTYIYVPTGGLPDTSVLPVMEIATAGNVTLGAVNLDSSGNAWMATGGALSTPIGTQTPLVLDSWNMVELRVRIGTGAVDQLEWRLGGVSVASSSGLTISDTVPGLANVGIDGAANTFTAYFDDIGINDSAGASQNSWPGEGRVVLLLPTADSATGTGWNLGTNTAPGGAGHTALANTPPQGVADLAAGSNPKQMRNATANANVNIDMTMTTYAAAGIPGGSVINVVDPITATAAPLVTSAKAGTVGVVSNPAISNVALGAGGTPGAFWSGATGGTYPVGWKISHGTATYAPSVTMTTAPVMRVTQVTSSTRIAVVCFMGMYVDYTPPSFASSLMLNQAVGRASNW